MSVNIIESELPISQHSIGECYNCKNTRHVRRVETYSAFGGASRGFYPFCFFCFAPVYRWRNGALKEGLVYETPYPRESYMPELEAAEQGVHPTVANAQVSEIVSNARNSG